MGFNFWVSLAPTKSTPKRKDISHFSKQADSSHPAKLTRMKRIFAVLFILIPSAFAGTAADLIQKAERDLNANLWDVASIHLTEALAQKNLDNATITRASLLLAECFVRGNKPGKAITILKQPLLKDNQLASFWHAQALAANQQTNQAITLLEKIARDKLHPYRSEAAWTAANLRLSNSENKEALTMLNHLDDLPPGPARATNHLLQAEIHLDSGSLKEARSVLERTADLPPHLTPLKQLLTASLKLREGSHAQAEKLFEALANFPKGQSKLRFQQTTLGLADSLAAQGKFKKASQTLLNYLADHKPSYNLDHILQRLLKWLPPQISSPNDPIVTQIDSWLPQPNDNPDPLESSILSAAGVSQTSPLSPLSDLEAFALFLKAEILHNFDTPAQKIEAKQLLRRLQILAPQHPLAARSMLHLAQWHQSEGDLDKAELLYDTALTSTNLPQLRGEAAFQLGLLFNKKRNYREASETFEQAAKLLPAPERQTALYNSKLAQLQTGEPPSQLIDTKNSQLEDTDLAELALESALLAENANEAQTKLNAFLVKHPKHPRATEARIALATAALARNPPDITLANAQIDTLSASLPSPEPTTKAQLDLLKLQIADVTDNLTQAIEQARALIKSYPNTQEAQKASLILGKALFLTGNYNDSQIVLKALADSSPDSNDAQAAILLAAKAAALGATAQSRQEALELFDQAIATQGPLQTLAKLEKAQLNINLNQLPTAIADLTKLYNEASEDSPLKLQTGMLLAKATYANSNSQAPTKDPENILKHFDELQSLAKPNSSESFQITYLKGLALEKLKVESDGESENRVRALAAFSSVLDTPLNAPIPDWEYFERSAFRALALLEAEERWEAAIAIAEKLAAFNGPRAPEAKTRAEQLRLQHMIWEN